MRLRRLLSFALVPLSAVPLALAAPLVVPSVENRVKEVHARERAPLVVRSERAHPRVRERATTAMRTKRERRR